MTVAEVIEYLHEYPPDAHVQVMVEGGARETVDAIFSRDNGTAVLLLS